MQREILEADPAADLVVYAVWLPFLGGTKEASDVSREVLPDPRVVHLWDGAAVTSDWFAENVEDGRGPAWDVYYLYGRDARWTEVPDPLVSSGATIIGRSDQLRTAIEPLLSTDQAG